MASFSWQGGHQNYCHDWEEDVSGNNIRLSIAADYLLENNSAQSPIQSHC